MSRESLQPGELMKAPQGLSQSLDLELSSEPFRVHMNSVTFKDDAAWRIQEIARRKMITEKMAMMEIMLAGLKSLGLISQKATIRDITNSRR